MSWVQLLSPAPNYAHSSKICNGAVGVFIPAFFAEFLIGGMNEKVVF
jgi:hypothetical protein